MLVDRVKHARHQSFLGVIITVLVITVHSIVSKCTSFRTNGHCTLPTRASHVFIYANDFIITFYGFCLCVRKRTIFCLFVNTDLQNAHLLN